MLLSLDSFTRLSKLRADLEECTVVRRSAFQ